MSDAEKPIPVWIDAVFGTVECRSWIEAELMPNGDMRFVGMGSKTVRDKDGKITECKIAPTGVTMTNNDPFANNDPFGRSRREVPWWRRLFGIGGE